MVKRRSLWRVGQRAGAVVLTLCLVATPSQADPIPGTYKSDDLGGLVDQGRWTESYAGGGALLAGNVINAASWVDPNLGEQWIISNLVSDGAVWDGSAGQWVTTYDTSGSTMLLKDTGPWWDPGDSPGLTAYTVDLDGFRLDTEPPDQQGDTTSLITAHGTLPQFSTPLVIYRVAFLLAIAYEEAGNEGEHPGAGYPPYLGFPPQTPPEDQLGHWGVIQGITMEIQPEVVPEPATMGLVSFGAIAMLIRRRRRRA